MKTHLVLTTATVMAVLGAFGVLPAPAQSVAAPNRSAQAVPPAQGSIAWGQDNCLYRFEAGAWRSLNRCRQTTPRRATPRSRQPQSGQNAADEVKLRSLLEELARLQQIQRVENAAAEARRRAAQPQIQLPAGCPAFEGELMAPGVRVYAPRNTPQCLTQAERDHINREMNQLAGISIGVGQRSACEAARSSRPYRSEYKDANGNTRYVLQDGTTVSSGGMLNSGWYWTPSGPMMTVCP